MAVMLTRIVLLLGVALVGAHAPGALAAEIKFPPHPRVAISTAEAEEARKSSDYDRQRDTAIRAGEASLAKHVEIPTGPGNWTFYYACPKHGCDLRPLSLAEHECPQCKQVHTDERTVEAYRTRLHNQADAAALKLAWAYWHSGDDKFAADVRRLLVKLADDYPTYPGRRDRWGRSGIFATIGGRRYIQSLDEAFAVIELAKAYDLTRNSPVWSDADRKHVEQDLFREIARTISWWNQGKNNHQTWYNAGLVCIGSVLADSAIIDKALNGSGGYYDQLKRSVGDDGLWYEGTMAYHNYALQAMVEIVEVGDRLGLKLKDEPRFKSMITGPLDYVYPNGQFPAINDSDRSSLANFDRHFAWAWQTYREPRFAQAYARGDAKRLLQLTGDAALRPQPLELRSKVLSDAGLAVLRRGEGENAACVMLDYGQHGDDHGHLDKLNIVLYAGGREWLLDPGRLSYSHAEYKTWVKETVAHNTVTIDGQSQARTTGELLSFDVQPDYVACVARSRGAYSGVELTRYLVLTDDLLIDRFVVSGDRPMQIDWHAHAQCEKLEPLDVSTPGESASLGTSHGYQHLRDGARWNLSAASRWKFASKNQSLGVLITGRGSEQVFRSLGIGYHVTDVAPCLTRRVQGKSASFWTVFELFPDRQLDVQREVSEPSAESLVIRTGKDRWEYSSQGQSITRRRLP